MFAHILVVRGAGKDTITVDVGDDGLGPLAAGLSTHRATRGMAILTDVNEENHAIWPEDVAHIKLIDSRTAPKSAVSKTKGK